MATDRPAADPNRPSPRAGDAEQPNRPAVADAGRETAGDRFREAVQAKQGDDEAEVDVWQGGFSPKAMFGNWALAAVVTVGLLIAILVLGVTPLLWIVWAVVSVGLWGWFGCQLAYRKLTCKYQLTTQRFIHETGLLKRVTDRIEVIDIDDVSVEQRVIERMVGVGTIKMVSSDRSHPKLVMPGIENVKDVAAKIDDLRRKERRRRGLHIESI